MAEGEISQGTLLGGRVTYRQYQYGHRSGFEPVLMAALVPARQTDHILEVGTGAGAALLCLAARVTGVRGTGLEREAAMARLAARNFADNGFGTLQAVQGDATRLPFAAQTFHHVMANPPWFGAHNTPSPDSIRALAHHAPCATLSLWIAELLRVLRARGSLTLALPAFAYTEALACLRPHCGGLSLLPLWPRAGQKAKIILIQAQKASHAPDSVCAGLVLHDETGLSAPAQAILREGQALILK